MICAGKSSKGHGKEDFMDKYRFQKSIPLKIFLHILMTLAFLVFAVCCGLFIKFIEIRGTRVVDAVAQTPDNSSYFSSNMFLDEYGRQLDAMYTGLAAIDRGKNSGYYLNTYVEAEKNFKYAIYDVEGKILYASEGWNEDDMDLSSAKYYYTVDLRGLKLFSINSIRSVAYSRDFSESDQNEKAEIIGETIAPGEGMSSEDIEGIAETVVGETESAPETVPNVNAANVGDAKDTDAENTDAENTDISNGMLSDGVISGKIEYGSNFTKYTYFYSFDETELAKNVGYICTYVPEELIEGDAFYEGYKDFDQWTKWGRLALISGCAAALAVLFCLIFLVTVAGHSHKKEGIYLYAFDRWYTEVFAAIIVIIVGSFAALILESRFRTGALSYFVAFSLCAYVVSVFGLLSLSRRIKANIFISNSLIYKICYGLYSVIYEGFISRRLIRKYIVVVFGLGILDFVLMVSIFIIENIFWTLFVCVIYIYEFIYVGRKLLLIQKIKDGVQKIASGDLEYKIDTSHMSGIFKEFAEDINNIGNGFNVAVEESIRSERMKADLITNVSHDIKTPLTSIINYVDLLKRENIQEEPIREYIEVLDMKSQRLKVLTEDLVEASRASSGNIRLEKNNINLVELVSQAMGNYQEKFDSKGLVPVIEAKEEKLVIFADGRRLYRVLDNLFNNTFKYAMANSRIYINTYAQDKKAYFVMKNISSAPLNISPEELTQRFVRGDESRTTEGSGLGLSIARSLTELHGGTFEIYLDGDLFKVTLSFEISAEV